MNSIFLYNWSHVLKAIMLLLSVLLLLRGHNEPGGGFVAGLIAATAFILDALAQNITAARRALRVPPRVLISLGLGTALASGFIGVAAGDPFLTGEWKAFDVPFMGSVIVGTPLLFDVGVYFLVTGVVLSTAFAMLEVGHAD